MTTRTRLRAELELDLLRILEGGGRMCVCALSCTGRERWKESRYTTALLRVSVKGVSQPKGGKWIDLLRHDDKTSTWHSDRKGKT